MDDEDLVLPGELDDIFEETIGHHCTAGVVRIIEKHQTGSLSIVRING